MVEKPELLDKLATVFTIVIMIALIFSMNALKGSAWEEAAGIILIIGFLDIGVIWWLMRQINVILALLLMLGSLLGAGYVLWKAITFTGGGINAWFKWLLGHF